MEGGWVGECIFADEPFTFVTCSYARVRVYVRASAAGALHVSRADNIGMPAALAAPAGEGLFVLTCHVCDVLRVADVP